MRQQIDAAPAPVTVSGQSRRERIVFSSLTKTFDGTTALDAVSFTVRRGEIHALLGANGAGKSTLIKLLAGFYQPDGGRIDVHDDADGSRHGIGFIHQDLALIPDLTVAENIALVCGYPRRGRGIDWRAVRAQAVAALELVSGGIDIDAKVDQLGRADQSVVAIARALYTNCAAIVLDEPTASLPDADVSRLFTILSRLRSEGVSVVYVTHRLDEVRKIADWVTVLRDGRVVADRSIEDFSDADIVREIVGGVVMPHQKSGGAHPAGPILRLAPGQMTEETAEFGVEVYAGEILGLAGLRGSGHEEVGRAIAGVRPLHMAHFEIDGAPVALSGVQAALHERIGFATSRREQEALAMTLTVRENLYMNPAQSLRWKGVFSGPRRERAAAAKLTREVRLRPENPEAVVATLSGGNQQKVVLGRWLNIDLRILVLEEPTMGIDVGARAEIYGLIQRLAVEGLAVIVISSDFEEIATICHRCLVFDRGAVRSELLGHDIQIEALTYLASGGKDRGEQ